MTIDIVEHQLALPDGYQDAFAIAETLDKPIAQFSGDRLQTIGHYPVIFLRKEADEGLRIDRDVEVSEIIDATATATEIAHEDIRSDSRKRPILEARQLSMYVARKTTDLSYPKIGREFGGRDHTTVINSVEKIKKLVMEGDEKTIGLLADIQAVLADLVKEGDIEALDRSSLMRFRSTTLLGSEQGVLAVTEFNANELHDPGIHGLESDQPLYRLHGLVNPETETGIYEEAIARFSGKQAMLLFAESSSVQSA